MSNTATTQALVRVASSMLDPGRQGLFATVDIEPGTHVMPSIQATLPQITPYIDQETSSAVTYSSKIVPPWPSVGNVGILNHSCTPNVEVSLIVPTQKVNVYAIQPIEAGDELTAAYCDVFRTREIRHKALPFKCLCIDCLLQRDAVKTSDAVHGGIGRDVSRLRWFRKLHFGMKLSEDIPMRLTVESMVSMRSEDIRPIPDIAKRLQERCVATGLGHSSMALTFDILAIFNLMVKDFDLARTMPDEQLDWLVKCLGPDHPRTVNLRLYIEGFSDGADDPYESMPDQDSLRAAIARSTLAEIHQGIDRLSLIAQGGPNASAVSDGLGVADQRPRNVNDRDEDNVGDHEQQANSNDMEQAGHARLWASFQSPIHGLGLRATRNIKAGELIMSVQTTLQIDATDLADPHVFLKAFRDGTPKEKEVLLDAITHNIMPDYGMPLKNMQDFDEALKNDGEDFLLDLHEAIPRHFHPFVDGSSTYTFFEDAWSLNHSCWPTAEACLDATGRLGVRAIVDIEEADEITISYIDVYQGGTARETALNFDCNCITCRLHYTNIQAYGQQEKQLTMVSTALTQMHAFRAKYPQSAVELSEDAAKNIEDDPETSDILKAIERVEESDWVTQGVVTSDFSIFYEVHHFILVANYSVHGDHDDIDKALVCKQHELELLERCLGSEHARALAAPKEITRMQGD
ncbi:hypothetical protein LTR17_001289 [Elasticomyces elasticus]|nr:hypothetical protein LTR17_001289 [Elasticomyces elasticus]